MRDTLPPLGDVPDDDARIQLRRVADWIADYREGIGARAIVPDVRPGEITSGFDAHMPDVGIPMERVLADLDTRVMPGIVHWGHPAFLGYFGSTSNTPALLGDMVAAALNVSAMTWKTSPAATELETVVLSWIRELVGLPEQHFGIVYDTASVAILHALAAARERAVPDARTLGLIGRGGTKTLRVYASDQAHSSVDKAMVMLGLGERNVVRIATDASFRMDVDALRDAMAADVAAGMQPMAVVATVGSTSTASVDPVEAIAELCDEYGAWLHVDAAYGGALGALPEGRWTMNGVERADSIVVNPHKWLFVPLDFSTLYVREPARLRDVFANTPEYLRGDTSNGSPAIDYMDYGIQLGRRFRALKAWMVLSAFGREGIASRIREHCRQAQRLADIIAATRDFELAAPVTMAVVCFRYRRAVMTDAEANAANEAIVERVNASGQAYITHTTLRGQVCMRVGFGNMRTTDAHVDSVWSLIVAEAQRV